MPAVKRAVVAVLTLGALSACGASEPDIAVRDGTVRVPSSPDVTAGYLTIENTGGADDTLTGVSTDAAKEAQIHETRNTGGEMKMRERDTVPVGADDTVTFEPGGLHLMLMKPEKLTPGDTVRLSLRFEESGTVNTEATVEKTGGSRGG